MRYIITIIFLLTIVNLTVSACIYPILISTTKLVLLQSQAIQDTNKHLDNVERLTDPRVIQDRTFDLLFRRGEFKDVP